MTSRVASVAPAVEALRNLAAYHPSLNHYCPLAAHHSLTRITEMGVGSSNINNQCVIREVRTQVLLIFTMSRLSTDTLLGRSQVTKGVWTFSWQVVYSVVICAYSPKCAISPFSRFGLIPFGGRSTAIKLSNGDVWVMASTPLTAETKAKLNELGPVKSVVLPCSRICHT